MSLYNYTFALLVKVLLQSHSSAMSENGYQLCIVNTDVHYSTAVQTTFNLLHPLSYHTHPRIICRARAWYKNNSSDLTHLSSGFDIPLFLFFLNLISIETIYVRNNCVQPSLGNTKENTINASTLQHHKITILSLWQHISATITQLPNADTHTHSFPSK